MLKLSTRKVCELARRFEGVTEKDHFGSDAFCANGRIFATVWHDKNRVTLMLDQEQQRAFLARDGSEGFIQIENAWGHNAIGVDLSSVDSKVFSEALKEAWANSKNKRSLPNRKKPLGTKAGGSKRSKIRSPKRRS